MTTQAQPEVPVENVEGEVAPEPEVPQVPESETPPVVEAPKPETPTVPSAKEIGLAVAEALKPASGQQLTPEQQEANIRALEQETGLDRKQLSGFYGMIQKQNLQQNAPMYEEIGESRASRILGELKPDLMNKVQEEMAKYPLEVRANPQAWEQAAYLVKGKYGDTIKPKAVTRESSSGRIVTGTEGNVGKGGLSEGKRGGAPAPKGKQYNADEQTMINRFFNGKSEDFERYKAKGASSTKKVEVGGGLADRAYQQLTGGVDA